MKKQIYDEKNGLSYTLHGDYYLPDLELNEEEPVYGKYGIMRKQFLKEHRSARYQYLVLTGKLTEHLNQVDKEVREKVEILMEQMAGQWGVTEELKMQDQMEWVAKIQTLKKSKLSHRYADKCGIERKKSLDFSYSLQLVFLCQLIMRQFLFYLFCNSLS